MVIVLVFHVYFFLQQSLGQEMPRDSGIATAHFYQAGAFPSPARSPYRDSASFTGDYCCIIIDPTFYLLHYPQSLNYQAISTTSSTQISEAWQIQTPQTTLPSRLQTYLLPAPRPVTSQALVRRRSRTRNHTCNRRNFVMTRIEMVLLERFRLVIPPCLWSPATRPCGAVVYSPGAAPLLQNAAIASVGPN
jgi:hypothetical protein